MIYQLLFTILTISLSANVMASPDMDDEQAPIIGLIAVTNHIEERSGVKMFMPADFSFNKKQLAAFVVRVDKDGYEMSIDVDTDCRGAHYCRVGSVAAMRGENPIIHYDKQNNEMTSSVLLKQDIKAYYTQGFALASYFPPNIVWRCKGVLYRISWNQSNVDAKKILIDLANSAMGENGC